MIIYISIIHVCQKTVLSLISLFLLCKVTIDLELHLNKKTKLKSSKGPFAHYDVYLYRLPKTKPRTTNGPTTKTTYGPGRAKGRVLRWEDDMYPPSPPCSVCGPESTRSLPASVNTELQPSRQPRPWTLNPYTPWRSVSQNVLMMWLPFWKCECMCCILLKKLSFRKWNSLFQK